MICPTCQGKGFIPDPRDLVRYSMDCKVVALHALCPTCNGQGITSCCDGMVMIEEAEKKPCCSQDR